MAFEADLPYNIYDYIDELLPADMSFDALPFAVEALREVKDENELAALRQAATASVKAFNELISFIKPGMTERQVANELDRLQKNLELTNRHLTRLLHLVIVQLCLMAKQQIK